MDQTVLSYLTHGNVISFSTFPSTVIGANFEEVKVLALLDRETANHWIDTETLHANVYPTLPPGTPDDPDSYQYVKLKHNNGEVSVVGVPWINPATIVVSAKGYLTIEFQDATPEDRDNIIRACSANGYIPTKVTHK